MAWEKPFHVLQERVSTTNEVRAMYVLEVHDALVSTPVILPMIRYV